MSCLRRRMHAVGTGIGFVLAMASPAGAAPFSAPVSVSGSDSNYPAVAMNARGDVVVGWSNLYDTAPRVEAVTQLAGAAFGAPSSLPSGQFNGALRVNVSSAGSAFAMWTTGSSTAFDLRSARGSIATGLAAESDVTRLPTNTRFAVARDGDALVAWNDYSGNGDLFAAFRPAGGALGPPTLVARGAWGSVTPFFDGMGTPGIAWTGVQDGEPRSAPLKAYFAARRTDGTFTSPLLLSDPREDVWSNPPRVAASPGGNLIVSWAARPASTAARAAFGPPGGTLVRAAIRAAGGSFGPPLAVARATIALSTQPAIDDRGNAIVAWEGDGRVAHRRAGQGFDAPHRLPEAPGGSSQQAVGFDNRGNGVVVYTDPAPRVHRVLAVVRRASGAWRRAQTLYTGSAVRGPALFISDLAFDEFGRGVVALASNADGRVRVAAYDSARVAGTDIFTGARVERPRAGRPPAVRFRLVKPARVEVRVERRMATRRVRYRRVRRLGLRGRPGVHRVSVAGLRRGHHRVTVLARDIAGRPLARRTLTLGSR